MWDFSYQEASEISQWTAIQREANTPWVCHKKHPGTNSDSECVPLDLMSKGQKWCQEVRVWEKCEKRKSINSQQWNCIDAIWGTTVFQNAYIDFWSAHEPRMWEINS